MRTNKKFSTRIAQHSHSFFTINFFILILALFLQESDADKRTTTGAEERKIRGSSNGGNNPQRMKIVSDLVPFQNVKNKPAIEAIEWFEQYAPPIYCVSDQISNLKFSCEGCDLEQKRFLAENTHDMSKLVNFPAIKVHGALSNGYKWNNIKLVCNGHDSAGNINSISAPIKVYYLRRPTILNHLYQSAISDLTGTGMNRFFMLNSNSGNQTFSLMCRVDANPPAHNFTWSIDGQWSSFGIGQWSSLGHSQEQGSVLRVIDRILSKSIACKASNGKSEWTESQPVYVEKAILPQLVKHNFGSLALAERNGIAAAGPLKNSIPLGFAADMYCGFTGYPKPRVQWVYSNYTGTIHSVDCGSKRFPDTESLHQEPVSKSKQIWNISSTCLIRLTKFDQLGTYWCRACVDLAQNQTICDTAPTTIPSYALFLNVTGPPNNDGRPVKIERNPAQPGRVQIKVPFCANPPPERNYFVLNGLTGIHLAEAEHNQFAIETKRDEFNPFCYESSINIEENGPGDPKPLEFFVKNSVGNVTILISLSPDPIVNINDSQQTADMMNNYGSVDSGNNNNVALTVLLILAVFLIIGACIFIYLWINRKACFSYRKNDEKSLACTKETRNSCPEKSGTAATIVDSSENEKTGNSEVKETWNNGKGYHYVSNEVIV